jgi:hypothetical protein
MGRNEYKGVLISGAINVDWEDIAVDSAGNIYIGDIGNNWNVRRDLVVYMIREPNPYSRASVYVERRIPFEYPDQKAYPPPPKQKNFDAEALFHANNHLYILTKNRGNWKTTLYRLETAAANRFNQAIRLGEFNARNWVTAADATPDGNKLVVLTLSALWMFECVPAKNESWLDGRVWWLPIKNGGMCEGVCFSGDNILISNESRALIRVPIARLLPVRQ